MPTIMDKALKASEEKKLINESEIPVSDWGKWGNIFDSIPKGQALVIEVEPAEKKQYTYAKIHGALSHHKKKGRFQNYYVRKAANKIYIANPVNPKKES